MRLYVWDKWKLMRYCFVIALIGMAFSVAGKVTNDVISTVASTTRKLPIYNIETTEPKISLTFDCAWGAEDMPQILDTLKENNIKATFFVLGEWVDKFPDVIKRMTEEGHDVANHSDTHPHIASLSYDNIKSEIKNANEKIERLNLIREQKNLNFKIEVDGGINAEIAKKIASKGADIIVSGSYIFNAENKKEAINSLK